MSFYRIDSNILRQDSEQLLALIQRFKTERDNLVAGEESLSAMWEGAARDSFHQAFIRDSGQMEAFAELMISYAKVMDTIADRYDMAEQRNTGIARNRTY